MFRGVWALEDNVGNKVRGNGDWKIAMDLHRREGGWGLTEEKKAGHQPIIISA